jgi:LPXTG-motif cell wall-anchored protein
MAFSFIKVVCMVDEPRASIGHVDCSAFTVPVTLDNSRSLSQTTFWVSYFLMLEDEDIESQEPFVVEAGETRVVPIAVRQDSWLEVLVTLAKDYWDDAGGWLANEYTSIDCASREGITTVTTATIGVPNCRTRTFPVTIDNRDVTETRGVEVNAEWMAAAYFNSYLEWFLVAPDAVRVVRVPIPQSIERMFVYVFPLDAQTTLDDGVLAERLMQMDCPNTAARPTVAVQGVKLPQTGGFNLALPLLGVALLTGGASMLALSGRRRRY